MAYKRRQVPPAVAMKNLRLGEADCCISESTAGYLSHLPVKKLLWKSDFQKPITREFVKVKSQKLGGREFWADKETGGLYDTKTGLHCANKTMKILNLEED